MASSTELPSDTVHNVSCLQDVEHLQCYQRPGQDNISRLICSAGAEGNRRAALMYNVLVALTFVIVPLAAVLNLAVVLTILLNRKLHTVINVLVTVLGINNLVWTGLPVMLVIQVKVVMPLLCSMRAMIFIITRGVSFTVIVAITVLRYLIVVRNHSYPAGRRNVLVFVSIAVLPAVVKWLIRRSHQVSGCRPVVAQTPDGLNIVAKYEKTIDLPTGIIAIVEYGGGLIILAFCYIYILITTVRSRRRLTNRNDLCRREVQRAVPDADREEFDSREQKKSWALCRPSRCPRTNESHPDRASSSPPLSGPSRSARPTASRRISSVLQDMDLAGHVNQQAFHGDSRNVNSDCDLLPAVEEVTTRQRTLSKSTPHAHSSTVSSLTPTMRQIAVQALEANVEAPCRGSAAQSQFSHCSPSCSAQEPQASEGVILQPSNLLGIETRERGMSCQPAPAVLPRQETRRGPRQPPGRVDVVATFSMTAFIIVLFVITFPYIVSVALINSRAVCVITADSRILSFIIVSGSMGLGAVVSPIVLVLFSVDFRKAFWCTCDRAVRWFRHTSQ